MIFDALLLKKLQQLFYRGRFAEVEKEIRECITRDGENYVFLMNLYFTNLAQKKSEEAQIFFDKAQKLNPNAYYEIAKESVLDREIMNVTITNEEINELNEIFSIKE